MEAGKRKKERRSAEKEKGRGNATKGGENGITSGRRESRVVTGSGRRQCALYDVLRFFRADARLLSRTCYTLARDRLII